MGFSFENLNVWQSSLDFANRVISIGTDLNSDRRHYRLIEQLESAALSVAQNIAEGKGRYAKKEFIHFLFIARGSLFEVITILTLFMQRQWIQQGQYDELKSRAYQIAGQLNALIESLRRSLSPEGVRPRADQPASSLELRASRQESP